jgi:hypothetical protein
MFPKTFRIKIVKATVINKCLELFKVGVAVERVDCRLERKETYRLEEEK